jgi:hypothetical protein
MVAAKSACDIACQSLRDRGYARLSKAELAQIVGDAATDLPALEASWDALPRDAYLRDGGRYRKRRHSCFVQALADRRLQPAAHRPHWQPTTYNALHGGMLRWFEPFEPTVVAARALRELLVGLGRLFAAVSPVERWHIEAHQFRIDTEGGVGRPTPEGAHRDGVDYVAVLLVGRSGVSGGETRVFDADGPHGVRFTMLEPWSALLLDDARVIHETTPLQPLEAQAAGHRDTLVLTYRASGFQEP